jgi:hypothetical protein
MKQIRWGVALVVGLSLLAGPAGARSSTHVFYLHGDDQFGEQQTADIFVLGKTDKLWMDMDSHKPEAGIPKSKQVPNAAVAPGDSCSGSPYFPVWVGAVSGTVKGDLTVKLDTIATPSSKIAVSLFRDLKTVDCFSQDPSGSIIPYEYKPPVAVTTAEVPEGQGSVIAKFKGLDFYVDQSLILQVQIYDQFNNPGSQVRILYDSADAASSIKFTCVPSNCVKS